MTYKTLLKIVLDFTDCLFTIIKFKEDKYDKKNIPKYTNFEFCNNI